jgi:ABC-type multidrug transport system ATPase subunit
MRTLNSLARHRGRTVVASIHQPRSDVFALMDQVDPFCEASDF